MADKKTIGDTQQFTVTLAPFKDKKGAAATVDGVPQWAVADTAVGTVEPAADGLSAVVKAAFPGATTVSVTADADLGAGVVPLSGEFELEVTAGQAAAVGFGFGDVTEQA